MTPETVAPQTPTTPAPKPEPTDSHDAPKVPVDPVAQEDAGKVREESGGYD